MRACVCMHEAMQTTCCTCQPSCMIGLGLGVVRLWRQCHGTRVAGSRSRVVSYPVQPRSMRSCPCAMIAQPSMCVDAFIPLVSRLGALPPCSVPHHVPNVPTHCCSTAGACLPSCRATCPAVDPPCRFSWPSTLVSRQAFGPRAGPSRQAGEGGGGGQAPYGIVWGATCGEGREEQ